MGTKRPGNRHSWEPPLVDQLAGLKKTNNLINRLFILASKPCNSAVVATDFECKSLLCAA